MKNIWLSILLLLVLFPGLAQAENCRNLDKNAQWAEDMQYVKSAIDVQAWDDALKKARSMYQQCSKVPILNYYVAVSLKGKGDDIKALEFFQRASKLTTDNVTSPEDSRIVWYARYEAEHPDRTDRAIMEKQSNIAMQEKKLEDLTENMTRYIHDEYEESVQRAGLGLWTGVGIGSAGIVMTALGAGLAFYTNDNFEISGEKKYSTDENGTYQSLANYQMKTRYAAGLALLGTGLALTVTGAVLTGIYGYQYTHIKSDDIEIAFHPGIQSIGMTVQF